MTLQDFLRTLIPGRAQLRPLRSNHEHRIPGEGASQAATSRGSIYTVGRSAGCDHPYDSRRDGTFLRAEAGSTAGDAKQPAFSRGTVKRGLAPPAKSSPKGVAT
jgi:hypothetical protein